MDAPIDAAALSKLRWRCRRGLLENDLLIGRLFEREQPVTRSEAGGLSALMELADHDLLDLLLGRSQPTGDLDRRDVREVLQAIRHRPRISA